MWDNITDGKLITGPDVTRATVITCIGLHSKLFIVTRPASP